MTKIARAISGDKKLIDWLSDLEHHCRESYIPCSSRLYLGNNVPIDMVLVDRNRSKTGTQRDTVLVM